MHTLEQLKTYNYQKIAAIAQSLKVTKTEAERWQDDAVLQRIIAADAKAKTPPPKAPEPKPQPQAPPKANYMKGGRMYCGVCDKLLTTDSQGNPTCH